MRSLLDVNVLVALFDADHVHHDVARTFLVAHATEGWASCPLTENGLVRVLSQPAYPGGVSPGEAMRLLTGATRAEVHAFWAADVSLLDAVDPTRVHGPRQLTDLYLLALAVRHGGRLATFDRHILWTAVPGAGEEHLVVVGTD